MFRENSTLCARPWPIEAVHNDTDARKVKKRFFGLFGYKKDLVSFRNLNIILIFFK